MTNHYLAKTNGQLFTLHSAYEVIIRDLQNLTTLEEFNNLGELFKELYALTQVLRAPSFVQMEIFLLTELGLPISANPNELKRYIGRLQYVCGMLKNKPSLVAYRQVHKGYECVALNMDGTLTPQASIVSEQEAIQFMASANADYYLPAAEM